MSIKVSKYQEYLRQTQPEIKKYSSINIEYIKISKE